MNKKILIGSIIAVVILILVSFTGVVGYQTTKSSTIATASPLFAVRSSRAIDEESKDLSCDYVGKGEIFRIPRNNKLLQIKATIDFIQTLDDIEYSGFQGLLISQYDKHDEIKNIEENRLLKLLNQIRHDTLEIDIESINENVDPPTRDCLTDAELMGTCDGSLYCFLKWLPIYVAGIIFIITIIISLSLNEHTILVCHWTDNSV